MPLILSPGGNSGLKGDRHTLSFYKANSVVVRNCKLRANSVAEALKFSGCTNVVVEDCHIVGGNEDAVDMVRGRNYYFVNVIFETRGSYAVTAKCGVEHLRFINCRFVGKPREGVFIDLGNWGDYDLLMDRKTTDVAISKSCEFEQGGHGVRTLHAGEVLYEGKIKEMPAVLVSSYFAIQRRTSRDRILQKYSKKELRWRP